MIYYSENKKGKKSIFEKIVTDGEDKVISRRKVEIPLLIAEREGKTWFMLYDDQMNILKEPSLYLNYDAEGNSLNTRKAEANALRQLYAFLSLSNYSVNNIGEIELNELIKFLQGINSNPEDYKTITMRSNSTVNQFLATYRCFFNAYGIKSKALFDNKIVNQEIHTFDGSITTESRIIYTNNLKESVYNKYTVPKYISPDEFEMLYKKAYEKNDKLAMCMMRLMYCYGLRLGEVLGLTTEDIRESHKDNVLVPIITLRNRMSDRPDQFCKNLGHVYNTAMYKSKEYTKAKSEIVIDYGMFEMLCDYINDEHENAIEKYPHNYKKGIADIVSYRDAPETNHYIFLSSRGTSLSSAGWNYHLRKYFNECNIKIDHDFKENNLSHRFRHGFAMLHSHYRKNPVNALELCKMMRHKNVNTTLIYFNPTETEEFIIKEDFTTELLDMIPSLKEGHNNFEQDNNF